ncbi:Prophage-derived-like putative protein YozM [Bacillus subtilis]|uniref:hypothetical protein n=1 Tax=Bacillus TaxID=1386 RepID=UPI00049A47D5|nr:hypothetical protein [Bacillus subtilis]MBL3637788.1 hypothetical protein [Alkalicoccobacillus gibsonii]AIC98488.1 hypothetical protein Q433_11315 [Bacillus subtilis subsp. subtilis str. OH 131.1]AWM21138.1 hypothetical protein DJ572_10130 [Bacillus subtilis]AXP48596.1 hypothetical protein DYS67_10275 [Bacillus subtilis subsp. subtilis]AYK63367.1 hypothetical protein D9C14_19410 [Bacillus subtilis subsp. subtilis]
MKKRLIGFLILVPILIISGITLIEANKKTPVEVLESAWDEFGLFSFEIGITDPAITIGMDQTKSEAKLREYLKDNLSREAKEKYKIYIFKDDIVKLEKEHQEYLQENNLNK